MPSPTPSVVERYETGAARGTVAWTSLVFAILQSVCTAIAGLQSLRLLIGVGSLALSASSVSLLDRLHADWLRVPMIAVALAGSLLNVIVLLHMRHLRHNAAGNWRRRTRGAGEKRSEAWQWTLSVLTLLSIAIEEYLHYGFFHHP